MLAALSVADAEIARRVRGDGERPYSWRDYGRRVADRIDTAARDKRIGRNRRERYVSFTPDNDGVGTMLARLPIEDLARCSVRVDTVARSLRTKGDPRNLEQLRAHVLVDLITGTHHDPDTTTKTVVLPPDHRYRPRQRMVQKPRINRRT